MGERWPVLLMCRELGIGGSERQLAEIAKALDRSRFEPHVACLWADGMRGDELRAAGVPILELRIHSFLRPEAIGAVWRLGRYIRRRRIQLVHTFDAPMNILGAPVAHLLRVPVTLSSQRATRALVTHKERHALRLTDRMVDGVVVNCLDMRRQLIEEERLPARLIHLCYNGVDLARFSPSPREARERPTIGVVCALRPEKDLPTLLEAFARVRAARPGIKLLMVGSGSLREELGEMSARLGLDDDCHFEPVTPDVAPWLRRIDIFALPSIYEAFSNSIMEAMACGCAVVASRVGGNPEQVEHERTGLLFRAGDVADLAACLDRLVASPELRQTLASAGNEFVRQNLSIEASARRMGEIYESFLGHAGAASRTSAKRSAIRSQE